MNQKHNRGLLLIAFFKLGKGLLLLILAVGVLRFLHKDVQQVLESWINMLRIDPENRYVSSLLAKVGLLDDKKLEELSALTAFYATMFLTEGIGLYLERRWAEWLSVIATASFLPIEIYELTKHLSALKVILLTGNILIVVFLIVMLRRDTAQDRH